jgi:hypothetical protein
MDASCEKCRSVRVVAIFVLRDLCGENWRDNFKPQALRKEAVDRLAERGCPACHAGLPTTPKRIS